MKMSTKHKIGTAVYHVIVCGIGLIMIYPIIWMAFSSFKESGDVLTTVNQLIPSKFVFENYVNGWAGFAGTSFSVFFRNSFFITILSTIGGVFSSVVVAYGFSRLHFKLKGLWFAIMMMTLMLPAQVLMIPQYIMFGSIGWTNSFLPVIVPEFFGKPFFIFMCMQFISGLPRELDEAAKIDGCSLFTIFSRIIMPLLKPAMITCAIFAFYWKWDDYMGSLLYLTEPKLYTVSIAVKQFADPTSVSDWGAMFAMCTLSLLPVIILFICLQKYIVDGIATSGLKG